MRDLTHNELTILIKNEIQKMQMEAIECERLSIQYIQHRATDILNYIQEYYALELISDI